MKSNTWIAEMNTSLKLILLTFALGACSSQEKYLKLDQEIICLKAPIGSVLPDDVYASKLSGPVYVRCPRNTFPAVVTKNPDGTKTVNAPPSGNGVPPAVKPVNVPEYSTAGGGVAGAGTPSEMSIAGHGRAFATQDGVTISSDAARDLVKNVNDAVKTLQDQAF